jgi:hypothetical protein
LVKGKSSDSSRIFGVHINILKPSGIRCWDNKKNCILLGSVIWCHLILTVNDSCLSKRPSRLIALIENDCVLWYDMIWYDMIYFVNCNWVYTRWQ